MKVAVNTLFLIPGEVGGTETYLREILLAIAREHPDVELALVTNRENDPALRRLLGGFGQCSFHSLAVRATNRYARIVLEQTRLPHLIRSIKPDVLWSPGYTMPLWAPCRQVVTIHDMQYRSHPDDLSCIARWTTHTLVTLAARRADAIIAISDFSRREIIKHTRCAADRIVAAHLGVDRAFGVRTPELPYPAPYILTVANSYPHKNLHGLVEAFARLVENIPHHLVIAGQPRRGEAALQKALRKISPERVRRISAMSRDQLIQLYQGADLFVFPSLYEGFGLPVLEAMMAGVPVVTTRDGAIPEIGGDAVEYADSRNPESLAVQIVSVLGWSPEQRADRVRLARARAASFTWSAAADTTVRALRGAWCSP